MSKKKIIIISSVIAVVFLSALAILIFNNVKKERELQEAIKLIEQQEKEAQELKEQQEQEEKERQEQEKLAEYESKWNALGNGKQYLALGSDHLKRTPKTTGVNASDGLYDYTYSEEFIGTLFMIADQYFDGASKSDLDTVLNVALNELPDNATDREVYDALIKFTEMFVDKETVIFGLGEPALGDSSNTSGGSATTGGTTSSGNTTGGGKGTTGTTGSGGSGGGTTSNNSGNSSTTEEEDWDDILKQFGSDTSEVDPDNKTDIDITLTPGGGN